MPAQVPDHVTEIHQRVNDFPAGSIDDLGAAVSGVVSNGDDGDADAADGNVTATATPTPTATES